MLLKASGLPERTKQSSSSESSGSLEPKQVDFLIIAKRAKAEISRLSL
ncbi:hypothetical protein IWQ49_003006 [Labrenzia sp. EL_126]|nr:hypothetical protein [Labrenzia sp. EL_126]